MTEPGCAGLVGRFVAMIVCHTSRQAGTGQRPKRTTGAVGALLAAVLIGPPLPAYAQLLDDLHPDTVSRLRAQARTAEARFERLARNMAPYTWGGFDGRTCDEIVGRFCLRFDSVAVSSRPAEPEVGRVIDERRTAVETLRRYFAAAPHERAAAGPLVRLLILDDRAAEAVSAARAFAALTADTLWGHLLLGLAHNAAGAAAEAEREFMHALLLMDEDTRREWTDPQWLLHHAELRRLRRLDARQRSDYERRFWTMSDPLWLTEANERWVEHMARHVESRLMARVPIVTGMLRWGRDLDELTVRYGTPSARSQVRGNNPWDPSSFIEYFDTAQRAFSPEQWLTEGLPAQPLPGEKPALYASRARSGYALRTVHRLIDLPHQVTRFLAGDDVIIRVDGALERPRNPARPPDGTRPRIGLFAYDSTFARRLYSVRDGPYWLADTVTFTLSLRVPPGTLVYSVEALDTGAAFAARARYALDAFVPADGPVVSDLLVSAPFQERLPDNRNDAALRPLHTLSIAAGSSIGVYAEVYRLRAAGPDMLRLEFALEPATGPGIISRVARWIGRTVGLLQPETDPRVAWREEVEAGTHPIALNLPLQTERTGRHVLVLRITDLQTGRTAETRRILMIT
jgi:hypothetical protein